MLDSLTLRKSFLAKLCVCESGMHRLSDYEQSFVRDLRVKYDSRSAMEELGGNVWNPTRKQWNLLADIATGLVHG